MDEVLASTTAATDEEVGGRTTGECTGKRKSWCMGLVKNKAR